MPQSFLTALACCAMLAGCASDSSSNSTPDGGGQSGHGNGDGAVGDRDSATGDVERDAAAMDGDVGGGDGDGSTGDGDGHTGDAGTAASAHCSPGVFLERFAGDGPNRADRCSTQGFEDALQAGIYEAEDLKATSLWNIQLEVPMTMGQSYALSFELSDTGPDQTQQVELWGTNGTCAADGVATQIYSQKSPMGRYIHCVEVTPAAAYTDLILVLRSLTKDDRTTVLRSASFCPTGSCQ